MSHNGHPSPVELHHAHEDERIRVRTRERQERRAAQRSLIRALRTMVQPDEPHHFAVPHLEEMGPRRVMDWPAAPGSFDMTGFAPGAVC